MIMEICVMIITVSVVVLAAFLVVTSYKSSTTMNLIQVEINQLATNSTELITELTALTKDIRKKSQSINFLFEGIEAHNHPRMNDCNHSYQREHLSKNAERVAEILDVVGVSIDLVTKITGEVKKYVKHN